MDHELQAFREAAAREQRGRGPMRRRYSATLQAQAVQYWTTRQQRGEGVKAVAMALGVAPWSLHRWTQRHAHVPFQRVRVAPVAPAPLPTISVVLTADGPRVDGLDVDAAARLLMLLR
jgi:transposase-like protein